MKFAIGFILINFAALAETTTVTTEALPTKQNFFGTFELRPSWTTNNGEEHSENTTEAGFNLGNSKISYVQWWNTNIYNPSDAPGGASGLSPTADEGLFRIRIKDIWKSADGKTSLSYQGRVYLPTLAPDRDAGMITKITNSVRIAQTLTPSLTVDATFTPVLYGFNRPGNENAANAGYRNQLVLNADVSLGEGITLSMPVVVQQTFFRNYLAGAPNNGATTLNVWIWPELAVDLSPTNTLGVAARTGNLAVSSSEVPALQNGLAETVAQVFWTVNL